MEHATFTYFSSQGSLKPTKLRSQTQKKNHPYLWAALTPCNVGSFLQKQQHHLTSNSDDFHDRNTLTYHTNIPHLFQCSLLPKIAQGPQVKHVYLLAWHIHKSTVHRSHSPMRCAELTQLKQRSLGVARQLKTHKYPCGCICILTNERVLQSKKEAN